MINFISDGLIVKIQIDRLIFLGYIHCSCVAPLCMLACTERGYSQVDMCTEIQESFHFGLQVSNLV